MDIKLVEFTADYVIPEDGKYLVRTESTFLKSIGYFQARCTKILKKGKYITAVDVSNQVVTHISELPLN